MSDGRLVINFGSLHQASSDIQSALNSMEAQLSQIEQDAGPLVSSWEGGAQQAYHQRQQKWRGAANDLSTMLRDIQKALDESAQSYAATESRNTQLFQ